ncbi:MAG: hypothetical protein DCC75_01615 [Proteobacteria bacterium]|nr:MAG: hypothetical protein DCC75_01615 [Pseudomonadota bacterium]
MADLERLFKCLAKGKVKYVLVGGVAANIHGSARLTNDIDIVYERSSRNLRNLSKALSPFNPYLRGAPPGLPFKFDEKTLKAGLNFTLTTSLGDIDLLGELLGIGSYKATAKNALKVNLFGLNLLCIDLIGLIRSKRAAGRPKDLEAIAELELLLERRNKGG